jgi:hypothetical protein
MDLLGLKMTESRTPYTTSTPWGTILKRARIAAEKAGGVCAVTISILAVNGEPLSWTAPDVTQFEPRKCASELLRFLTLGSAMIVDVDDEGKVVQGE